MRFQAFSDMVWLYPDMELKEQTVKHEAIAARGGSFGVQILTDLTLQEGADVECGFQADAAIRCFTHQLIASRVEENSGKNTMTAASYEEVASFVTRKAPYEVLEAAKPLDDGRLRPGRLALFLLITVDADVLPGNYRTVFTMKTAEDVLELPVEIKVSAAVVPELKEARFGMVNWLRLPDIAFGHHVEMYSDEFWKLVDLYLENQIGLRTNHIKLPPAEVIRDADGQVIDFDFSVAERVGKMALEHGFSYIYGDFVARFQSWDKGDHFLLWDRDVAVTSIEAYRQLAIYFKKLWGIVQANHWEEHWMQCLVDEPQFANAPAYRALSGICRRFMPGVIIHDPVETTDLGGAVDIWCVKQAVYEKYLEAFQKLQSYGEQMWVYTCGFPAGYWMNRSTDLPLTAGRLPMWMCIKYQMTGFLHWGYNGYSDREPFMYNCFNYRDGKALPPGDGFIVYPGDDGRPWNSVRSFSQRFGAEDYEILIQLDRESQMRFVDRLCTTFEEYESDPAVFDQVRRELLESF